MICLAIDSSGKTASAAICRDQTVVAEYNINNGYTHSQTLVPAVESVFNLSGTDKRELDYIVCSRGPGSFTGLRIGMATAKGLGFGLNKPLSAVSSLDALAYSVMSRDALIVPIMDARRNQVYCAVYENSLKGFNQTEDYAAMDINDLILLLKAKGRPAIFLGDGVAVYRAALEAEPFVSFPAECSMLQRAASLGLLSNRLVLDGGLIPGKSAELMYLRLSQAEREQGIIV